jgi:hypothetical protein
MSVALWGVVASWLVGLILLFGAREISAYRRAKSDPHERVPYTKARLRRRLAVTGCLIAEVLLLTLVRLTLTPVKPFWFLIYVAVVLLLAAAMVVLSVLDLKESIRIGSAGLKDLREEFLHDASRMRYKGE